MEGLKATKGGVVIQLWQPLPGSQAQLVYIKDEKQLYCRKDVVDIHIWPIFRFLKKEEIDNIEVAFVYNEKEGYSGIYVTKNDDVFAIGRNNDHLLGNDQWPDSFNARRVDELCGKKVKYFSCGSRHIMALTEDGIVYNWGANYFYQLGIEKKKSIPVPSIVEGLSSKKVIQIASSSSYNFVLCDDNSIYEWGIRGDADDERVTPEVPTLVGGKLQGKKIVSIACSNSGSFALTADGRIYSWGVCLFGTRGNNDASDETNTPVKIPTLSNVFITKIAAGEDHILALSDTGTVYAWGRNDYGQSGDDDMDSDNYIYSPAPVKLKNHKNMKESINGNNVEAKIASQKIIDIATSPFSDTSAALDDKYRVWMWGDCKGQKLCTPFLTKFKSMHEVFVFCSHYMCTYRPITSKNIKKRSICDYIGNCFNDQVTSDLTIIVERREIKVHASVLKIRSTYFKNMLRDEWKENEENVLKIDDSTYVAYKALLEYFYTDSLNVAPDSAFELLELARKYGEEELEEMCEKVIKNSIRLDNVTSAYVTSKNMQVEGLRTFCLKFMMNNFTNLVNSDDFSQLNAATMAEILMEASRNSIFKT